MLDGLLRFHRFDGSVVDIPCNTVSQDLILDLLALIRDSCRPESRPVAGATLWPPLSLGDSDVDLVHYLNEALELLGDARVIHARTRQTVFHRSGAWASVLDRYRPGFLHATIIAATARDLIIVNRRRTGLEGVRACEYSVVVTSIARAGLTLERLDEPRWQGVRRLTFAPTTISIESIDDDGVEQAIRGLLSDRRLRGWSDVVR